MQTPLSLIHRHEDLKHRVEFRPARKSCAPVKMYASEPNINKLPKICTTPKPANELMINRDLINEAHRDNDHDLVFLRQLGSGAFSKVYLVNDKTCDKLAVCKRIKASSVKYVVYDEEARGMIPYELHVLKNLRCHDEYFVSFHRWMRVNNEYFIMMNYLGDNWMDMYDYLCSTKGPENAYQVKEIFGKVLDAAYFLHLCGLTHNDIKGTIYPLRCSCDINILTVYSGYVLQMRI